MEIKKFLKILDKANIAYIEKDGKILITEKGYVDLRSLTTLPEGIQFNNQGYVYLRSLTTLPERAHHFKGALENYKRAQEIANDPQNHTGGQVEKAKSVINDFEANYSDFLAAYTNKKMLPSS